MDDIPKVFSSPFLAGPVHADNPEACGRFTMPHGSCSGMFCVDGYNVPCPPPEPPKPPPPPPPDCGDALAGGLGIAGIIATFIAAESFPGPVVPG